MDKELLEIALSAVQRAKEKVRDCDVFVEKRKVLSLELEKGDLKQVRSFWDEGISVRAFWKGGRGFAYVSSLEKRKVEEVVDKAVALARASQPDPHFKSLPPGEEGQKVEGVCDERVFHLTPEDLTKWGEEIVENAKRVDEEALVSGGIQAVAAEYAIANTEGVSIEDRKTILGSSATVILKKGDEVASFSDYDVARNLEDFQPTSIGEKACLQAKEFFGAKQAPTGSFPVVFSYLVYPSWVWSLASAANAEEVQRGRSFLAGKKGEKIAVEDLTIKDLPFVEGGMESGGYDGEGAPHKEMTFIEEGRLLSYFHNSYTAGKAGEENTGHAARGYYRSGVGISPTNLQVMPGDWTLEEMIQDMKRGILVLQSGIPVNNASGDSSGPIDFGFMIEEGEKSYPLKNTTLGFNMLDLLQNIDAISRDYREEPGVKMLAIRVKHLKIGGK